MAKRWQKLLDNLCYDNIIEKYESTQDFSGCFFDWECGAGWMI